jgi:hypothetical protein
MKLLSCFALVFSLTLSASVHAQKADDSLWKSVKEAERAHLGLGSLEGLKALKAYRIGIRGMLWSLFRWTIPAITARL